MKRRQFLQAGLLSASTLITIKTHGGLALSSALTNPKRLIVIFLRGAVDGLNVIVPYQDQDYYSARPTIAVPQPGKEGGAIDLDGYFGLHPALASIFPLWQQGNLAFIHSAGSPDPTRSHFDAQDNMERGTPGDPKTSDGWMNRLLATLSDHNPIQALNLGASTPRILSGRMPVASLALGKNAANPIALDNAEVGSAFDRLYAKKGHLGQAYQEGRLARKALLEDLDAENKMANNGAPLPNGFPKDAQRLAQIMNKDPRVALAFIGLGGWDTHVNQEQQLARNLAQLGKGLAALKTTLGSTYADTTILVMSEFGRTVHENGNGGTDHGHGNVMWLLGGGVKGGKVYGEWRGLAKEQLYEASDLAITTDFRDVIAPVLEQHLQLPAAKLNQIFPNYKPMQSNLNLYG